MIKKHLWRIIVHTLLRTPWRQHVWPVHFHSMEQSSKSMSEMTYIVSSGALNSTHSLTHVNITEFIFGHLLIAFLFAHWEQLLSVFCRLECYRNIDMVYKSYRIKAESWLEIECQITEDEELKILWTSMLVLCFLDVI